MYEIVIETIYNVISLVVNDYKSPKVKEILEQPYVVRFEIYPISGKIKSKGKPKKKGLIKCMNFGPNQEKQCDTNI